MLLLAGTVFSELCSGIRLWLGLAPCCCCQWPGPDASCLLVVACACVLARICNQPEPMGSAAVQGNTRSAESAGPRWGALRQGQCSPWRCWRRRPRCCGGSSGCSTSRCRRCTPAAGAPTRRQPAAVSTVQHQCLARQAVAGSAQLPMVAARAPPSHPHPPCPSSSPCCSSFPPRAGRTRTAPACCCLRSRATAAPQCCCPGPSPF